MQEEEVQQLLLELMPPWHYWTVKPFKKLLNDDAVSMGMYYTLRLIWWYDSPVIMGELAKTAQCSKQQMSKMIGKLTECGYVEQVRDPTDRRIIRLQVTEKGASYMEHLEEQTKKSYRPMLKAIPEEDRERFFNALKTLHEVFDKMKPEMLSIPENDKERKDDCA